MSVRTKNVHARMARREAPNKLNTAHSQSEPARDKLKVAFGGLTSRA